MKSTLKIILFILIGLFSGFSATAQSNTFQFTDTIFKVAAIKVVRFDYRYYNINVTFHDRSYENAKIADSIVTFLNHNRRIAIEIGAHEDIRPTEAYCWALTKRMAENLRDELVEKKVDEKQLKIKGYGKSKPLFTESKIYKLKAPEEKELAHSLNRRIELKILKVE